MIDNFSWGGRGRLTIAAWNADQIEIAAISQSISASTVSILDDRIAEDFDDSTASDPNNSLENQIKRDNQLEEILGTTLEEIERRQYWLGDDYPFKLSDGGLRYRPSQTGAYEYCLAISQAPNITANPYTELIRYFEIFVADVFSVFLGIGSDFLRTGAPSIKHLKSSTGFRNGIDRLHSETDEWEWGPQSDVGEDLTTVKDEGLDFVVWKRIDDRKGALFIVGQCACGKTDWHEKDQDIDADFKKVGRWLKKVSYVTPVRAFALPHPITAKNIFSTLTDRAGLTMDRIRLTKVAESTYNREHFISQHKSVLSRLTQVVVNGG